jgi:hypothetical protein
VSEPAIQVRKKRFDHEIAKASDERRLLVVTEELVEYRHSSAWLQHALCFAQTSFRLWHDREDQVEDHGVERLVPERELPCIHDLGVHGDAQAIGASPAPLQHRWRDVHSSDRYVSRQVFEVEASAGPDQEHMRAG